MIDTPGIMRTLDQADCRQALWTKLRLLPTIEDQGRGAQVSQTQYQRLLRLANQTVSWSIGPQPPGELFPPEVLMALGSQTIITKNDLALSSPVGALWMQLLPLLIDSSEHQNTSNLVSWHEIDLQECRAYTLSEKLSSLATLSKQRHKLLATGRSAMFSRSASYMGSKAVLAGQLLDIVASIEPGIGTVVDLMCGSGAMSGAFARYYTTIASDAQSFCGLLALVQGGGMTGARGRAIADEVVHGARNRYRALGLDQLSKIDAEGILINCELSPAIHDAAMRAQQARTATWEDHRLGSLEEVTHAWRDGRLLSHLYAGIYFGERQSAELDCLRQAIEDLPDTIDQKWALGALVCAASACAHTYGGHFAQPKLDISANGRMRGELSEALKQRSMSIMHEFVVRLTNLAEESEFTKCPVELVSGPWQQALSEIASRNNEGGVCVYLDPPYTRDEYSRYYHVLEAIVRYRPQSVSGKGRLPQRGSPGRFASPLSGRQAKAMEMKIAEIIQACLANDWSCLWSYSNTGTASLSGTLSHLDGVANRMEVFRMDHAYKAQGKHSSKKVQEYAIYLKK